MRLDFSLIVDWAFYVAGIIDELFAAANKMHQTRSLKDFGAQSWVKNCFENLVNSLIGFNFL
jgi:hypothetical protein